MNLFLKNFSVFIVFWLVTVPANGHAAARTIYSSFPAAGLRLHFTQSESGLAARLAGEIPAMKDFLGKMQLELPQPLHVVLDSSLAGGFRTSIIPLYRVRIALRPPGPMDDGGVEPDPWTYFLFMGLSRQALHASCRGIPAAARRLMGAVISPNRILPPWVTDGFCHLLWELFNGYPGRLSVTSLDASIRQTASWPGLDKISNHPGAWPGAECYRIWGRPFVRWLYRLYGYKSLLEFIKNHGGAVIPFEVDHGARKIFGQSWRQLWLAFSRKTGRLSKIPVPDKDLLYGPLHPGEAFPRDAGDDGLRVVYRGSRPYLAICSRDGKKILLSPPPEVKALDGPVLGPSGQIAVAGCSGGNWDIWLYDRRWHRIIQAPATQCHPAFVPAGLVFASDHEGSFAIYDRGWNRLSGCSSAGLHPANNSYLCLTSRGWRLARLDGEHLLYQQPKDGVVPGRPEKILKPKQAFLIERYSFINNIKPNFMAPDIFIDGHNLELGLVTRAEDPLGRASCQAGLRYAFSPDYPAWKLAAGYRPWSARVTSYPLEYTTARASKVAEARKEASVVWQPLGGLSLSINGRYFDNLYHESPVPSETEFWLAGKFNWSWGKLQGWLQLELIETRGPSFFGWMRWQPDRAGHWDFSLFGGKSWGNLTNGHNTFRIGGNLTEGFFTQRSTRLFPLRGFPANSLESGQAFSGRAEYFVDPARIDAGHGTLPLFMHKLRTGIFLDYGLASKRLAADQLLAGSGLEFVASLELGWELNAELSLAVAWPLTQPDYLNRQGPVLLLQIGKPL